MPWIQRYKEKRSQLANERDSNYSENERSPGFYRYKDPNSGFADHDFYELVPMASPIVETIPHPAATPVNPGNQSYTLPTVPTDVTNCHHFIPNLYLHTHKGTLTTMRYRSICHVSMALTIAWRK